MSLQLDDDPAGAFSPLRQIPARGRVRGALALLGPAFVASVAYIDPGNFATNFAPGAQSSGHSWPNRSGAARRPR